MKKCRKKPYPKGSWAPLLSLLFVLIAICPAMAQQPPVKGVIRDKDGRPVAAATITIKGKKTATSSSEDGSFTIAAGPGDVLVISSVGFDRHEVKIGIRPMLLNINLSDRADALNDVVVVGYGTVKRKDLTGSVGIVKVDDAKKTATYDVAKSLQGQVAGVTVHGSGEPGGYVQIKIRGISSFINNNPLFVIDGVQTDAPFDFTSDDIESIQILKDASSAALYGARAATGVVIITTKKGKAGPLKINYNGYAGFQHIAKKLAVTDREGYQKITNAACVNAGRPILPVNDPSSPSFIDNINTDWQKETFKTGVIQDHNIGLSGGTDAAAYNLSLAYFDQNGSFKGPQSYNRYTLNSNLQGKKGIFAYGAKFAYTQSHKVDYGYPHLHPGVGNTVTGLLQAIPTVGVYDSTRLGGYGGSHDNQSIFINPVGVNNLINNYDNRNRFLGNLWAELEIVKNLKYKINLSYDYTSGKSFYFEPTYDLGWYYLNSSAFMSENRSSGYVKQVENLLTYKLDFGRSKVDFLAGSSYLDGEGESTTGTGLGFSQPYFYQFNLATSTTLVSGSQENSLIGYLGRMNYNFDERYLLTGNIRRDGSSRFGPTHRWGTFGSVAGAWVISNEKFIHLPTAISRLKLRGGYGTLGNENVGNYLYQSSVDANTSYVFNNVLAPGTTQVAFVDPNIKWETKITSNVAIDLGLFQDHLNFTAEYYRNTSRDVIISVPIPLSAGPFYGVPGGYATNSVTTNGGTFRNTGFEFTVDYKGGSKDFTYNINANISTLQNKVLKLGNIKGNAYYGAGSKTEVGHSAGELYGYQTEGLFQNTADIAAHAFQNAQTAPGDIRFKAQNGKDNDNSYTITDANDRVYLGRAIPNLYYGFNFSASYKNFDCSIFLQGSAGNKVFNGIYANLMVEQYTNHSVDALNFWTPTNTKTNVPRPVILDPNGNARFSDRFVQDGSYVKIQNAQIGYTIPATMLNRTKIIRNFRVYISGQNLYTFTKYKGYDPDFFSDGLLSRGFDSGSFPNPRGILLGIQAGF